MISVGGKGKMLKSIFSQGNSSCHDPEKIRLDEYFREGERVVIHSSKFAVLFFLLFAAFCFPQSVSKAPKPSPTTSPAAKAAPPVKSSLFPAVVAKVNGEEILGTVLENLVRSELSAIGDPEWKDLRGEYRTELALEKITLLINTKLLALEAKSSGIQATDTEVQAEMQKIAKTFKNDEEMNAALAKQGQDRASLAKSLKESLITSKYLETTIQRKITVTPEEVAKYYSSKSEEFHHPDIVKTSHILIKVAGDTPEQSAAARKRVDDILARLNKGADFAELAKQYSEDPSAANGGDVGYSAKEALPPEYGEAAFALPIGGVTSVQTQLGYYIIRVTDIKKEGQFALEDIKADLKGVLKNQKYQEELDKLISRLREKADIEILFSTKELLKP
jgi:peptidyl-prolyl cis-trans isomerase C